MQEWSIQFRLAVRGLNRRVPDTLISLFQENIYAFPQPSFGTFAGSSLNL